MAPEILRDSHQHPLQPKVGKPFLPLPAEPPVWQRWPVTTLMGLRRGAEAIGFHARAVRADDALLTRLEAIPLPAICHWQGNHWVVLNGRQGRKLVIADPAVGIRKLSMQEFRQRWGNGALLLLEPDLNRLLQQPEEQRAPFLRFLRLTWPLPSRC